MEKVLTALGALALAVGLWFSVHASGPGTSAHEEAPTSNERQSPKHADVTSNTTAITSSHHASAVSAEISSPAFAAGRDAPTRQRVFRLRLDGDRCVLEAIEEVTGNFGRRRRMEWRAGMLYCQLVDVSGRILAQKTLHAPDQVCVVLDSNDPAGGTRPVRLTPAIPLVFQVRFPESDGAVRLDVYRLTTNVPARADSAPAGLLLGSIPVPSKS